MGANSRDLLNLINSSLAHIYCSTILLNYGLIRLNKFILQINLHLCNLISLCLTLLISNQTFDVTGTEVCP
jgi:hypothetical protein